MIKKFVIKSCMKTIRNNYPEYDGTKLEKIQYGLESLYLSVTKVIVIILLSILLNTFIETLVIFLLFNIIRATGFGLHASNSWICWITSIPTFGFGPFICKYLKLNFNILIILSVISILCFIFFAPADTHKRPLIRKKRRIIYKILTVLIGIGYLLIILLINNQFIKNAIVFSMILETILICPLTYKLFKLPYSNYKKYNK